MPKYFNYFPKTIYTLDDNNKNIQTLTNITTKFSFEDSFKNNSVLYYEYAVTDGETPEMIAHKVYGSSEKHWIILALNDIYNPIHDWPMEQRSLINYIDLTYEAQADTANGETGLEWAQTNNYAYYKIETQTNALTNDKDVVKYQIDSATYANTATESVSYTLQSGANVTISTTKESQTYYQYEIQKNDDKRIIKILKPEFASTVEEEMIKVLQ